VTRFGSFSEGGYRDRPCPLPGNSKVSKYSLAAGLNAHKAGFVRRRGSSTARHATEACDIRPQLRSRRCACTHGPPVPSSLPTPGTRLTATPLVTAVVEDCMVPMLLGKKAGKAVKKLSQSVGVALRVSAADGVCRGRATSAEAAREATRRLEEKVRQQAAFVVGRSGTSLEEVLLTPRSTVMMYIVGGSRGNRPCGRPSPFFCGDCFPSIWGRGGWHRRGRWGWKGVLSVLNAPCGVPLARAREGRGWIFASEVGVKVSSQHLRYFSEGRSNISQVYTRDDPHEPCTATT